jgi:DnaJ-class molecular chaperone
LLSVLFFAGGAVVFYVVSLQLHPRRVCRGCGGTGRHRGAMFWWGDRACTKCGGAPRHRRWGVQMLYGAPGRRTRAEQAAKDAGRRRGALR